MQLIIAIIVLCLDCVKLLHKIVTRYMNAVKRKPVFWVFRPGPTQTELSSTATVDGYALVLCNHGPSSGDFDFLFFNPLL